MEGDRQGDQAGSFKCQQQLGVSVGYVMAQIIIHDAEDACSRYQTEDASGKEDSGR